MRASAGLKQFRQFRFVWRQYVGELRAADFQTSNYIGDVEQKKSRALS